MQLIARKRNRPLCKPHLRPHPAQPKKLEDMRQHLPVTPITNIIRHTHPGPIVSTKAVPHISSCHRPTTQHCLRQQPAVELQHLASIRRRPLRKEHHRQPRIHRSLHPTTSLHRRPAMPPLHIPRPRHRRHPPHHRPLCNLRLRHKHTRMQRREHHNIHIAQVVRDHRPALRKPPHDVNLNPQPPHRPRTKPMQPVCPLLPRLRPLHRKLRAEHHKHSRQPNTPLHCPKKIRQIQILVSVNPQAAPCPKTPNRCSAVYAVTSAAQRPNSRSCRRQPAAHPSQLGLPPPRAPHPGAPPHGSHS